MHFSSPLPTSGMIEKRVGTEAVVIRKLDAKLDLLYFALTATATAYLFCGHFSATYLSGSPPTLSVPIVEWLIPLVLYVSIGFYLFWSARILGVAIGQRRFDDPVLIPLLLSAILVHTAFLVNAWNVAAGIWILSEEFCVILLSSLLFVDGTIRLFNPKISKVHLLVAQQLKRIAKP
jgi:hypothetical protein